jgi:multidrug efflux pump subunit AcrA (membrane-fusion protein)
LTNQNCGVQRLDLRMAELTLTNKRGLREKKVISETEALQAEASRNIAAANVVEARLTVQLSESMKLYAPISGIISRSFVAEDAFITKEAREQSRYGADHPAESNSGEISHSPDPVESRRCLHGAALVWCRRPEFVAVLRSPQSL